ncbi:DUF2993 domain-containing protein [Streptomyces sp. NPDC060194]|uniref:LmeA family phospholipid-binding protein n=1 Tax=Streptomyces sp. NPDC060194 TaxID=3347069 RepID=UPI00365A3E5A
MRPPTRIAHRTANPYEELAQLADPETEFADPAANSRWSARRRDDRDEPDTWSPPNHRARGRSSLTGLSRAAKTVLLCALVAALLLVGDRFAVLYAQNAAAEKIRSSLHLATEPQVDIHGFPFLTQVLDERIDRVDVAVPDVSANRVSLAEVRATARDVRIVGDLPSSVKGAVVGSVDGDVLLSFDDLNRELGASQVRFTENGRGSVDVAGALPVAGHEVRVRAEAHVRRDGDRAVSTTLDHMELDVPGIAVYRPGKDRAHSGLRLHPEAARALAREQEKVRALLEVPAVVKRLGLPERRVRQALRSEEQMHELTGAPRFADGLMKANLIDVVADHPWLLKKAGIDPGMVAALLALRPPELSERLSLSFSLPKDPDRLKLRHVTVERDGIRADLAGSGLRLG